MQEKRAAIGTQDRGLKTATGKGAVVIESHSSDPGFLGRFKARFSPGTFGSQGTAKAKERKEFTEVAL